MRKYLAKVRLSLLPFADEKKSAFLVGYMNTRLPILGLSVPQQRVVAKIGYSFLSLPQKQVDAIWQYIWMHGKEFEVLSQCLLHYSCHKDELGLAEWKFLKNWVKRIDNWAHSDTLSDLFATVHERFPNIVYPQYEKWNRSGRPWEVRQSLVGLFYYAQGREKQPSFSKAMRMIRGAFYHGDLYVQKGVGWALRECYNVYPSRTYAFLKERARDLSSTAWQAATEKLTRQEKVDLKHLRKKL